MYSYICIRQKCLSTFLHLAFSLTIIKRKNSYEKYVDSKHFEKWEKPEFKLFASKNITIADCAQCKQL